MAKTENIKVPTLARKVVEREHKYNHKLFGLLFKREHLYSKRRFSLNQNEIRLLVCKTNFYVCKPVVGGKRY